MSVDSANVLAWRGELGALEARLGELFVRAEPRRQWPAPERGSMGYERVGPCSGAPGWACRSVA